MKTQDSWPVNENDEIILRVGSGSSVKTGYISQDKIPTDDAATVAAVVIQGMSSPKIATTRTLTTADDCKVLVATAPAVFTLPVNMPEGFGCAFRGECSFVAGGGVTLNDLRIAGATQPLWCALVNIGVNTYDLIGGKV